MYMNVFTSVLLSPKLFREITVFYKHYFPAQILYYNLASTKGTNFTDRWPNDHFPFGHNQQATSKFWPLATLHQLLQHLTFSNLQVYYYFLFIKSVEISEIKNTL